MRDTASWFSGKMASPLRDCGFHSIYPRNNRYAIGAFRDALTFVYALPIATTIRNETFRLPVLSLYRVLPLSLASGRRHVFDKTHTNTSTTLPGWGERPKEFGLHKIVRAEESH